MSCKQLFISYGWIHHESSQPSRTIRGIYGEGDAETFDRSSPTMNTRTFGRIPRSVASSKDQSSSQNRIASSSHLNASATHSHAYDDMDIHSNTIHSPFSRTPTSSSSSSSNMNNLNEGSSADIMSLGAHLSFIALAVFMSFGLSLVAHILEIELHWNRYVLSGVPLYKLSMLCALVCMQVSLATTTMKFKRDWFMRLCGLMLDLLVICAISTALPNIESWSDTHYMHCSLFVIICLSWNIFCFFHIAKEIFPNYWFSRAVTISGGVLGHPFMALLLARTLDPHLLSPVPVAYAYKLMLIIIPSTTVKNAIIIKLVDDYGLFMAILVAWLVVIAWYTIYYNHFKHRFIHSKAKKEDYTSQSKASLHQSHDEDDDKDKGGNIKSRSQRNNDDNQSTIHNTDRGNTVSDEEDDYVRMSDENASFLRASSSSSNLKDRRSSTSKSPMRDNRTTTNSVHRNTDKKMKTKLYVRQDGLELADDDDEEAFLENDDSSDPGNGTSSSSRGTKYGIPTINKLSYQLDHNTTNTSSTNLNKTIYTEKIKLNFIHESSESSSILTVDQLYKVWSFLPAIYSDKSWFLNFSLRRDGANLHTLLSLCITKDMFGRAEPKCTVIIIEDSWGYVFGGFLAHSLEDRPVCVS